MSNEKCPYKKMDEENRKNHNLTHYCSSTPFVEGESLNLITNNLGSAGGYTKCGCGEFVRRN